jgi:hypothetical protein
MSTRLRAGDWVEVRSREEILATLDARGRLEFLPFMPEMFQYCGRRFRVFRRAHKTCDTVNRTGGRRLTDGVHLEDVRCDGRGHGGCQAACLIFWKEAWLKGVSPPSRLRSLMSRTSSNRDGAHREAARGACTEKAVEAAAMAPGSPSEDPTYVCQATALPSFTTLLPWWDFRQYVEDYVAGNVTIPEMLKGVVNVNYVSLVQMSNRRGLRLGPGLVRLYDRFQSLVGGVPFPEKSGTRKPGEATADRPFHVKAGDLVRVKSYPEVLETLDAKNKHRGMYFGSEEVPYCGKTFKIRAVVRRIIHEQTGKMVNLRGNNVILDGAWCGARYSDRRMFCPRAIFPIWREQWLESAAGTSAS